MAYFGTIPADSCRFQPIPIILSSFLIIGELSFSFVEIVVEMVLQLDNNFAFISKDKMFLCISFKVTSAPIPFSRLTVHSLFKPPTKLTYSPTHSLPPTSSLCWLHTAPPSSLPVFQLLPVSNHVQDITQLLPQLDIIKVN